MADDRPAIPAELRRRVLIEAGHRCAIPTCRYIETDLHHIEPWESCRRHEYENLVALCPNCHRRADNGEIDRKSLRIYKASLRFTHDRFSQFEVDVLLEASQSATPPLFPPAMRLLLKRLLDADYVQLQNHPTMGVWSMGMQISPSLVCITQKGRDYVESLGEDIWRSEIS